MKIINTFLHEGAILRPGSDVPEGISESTLLTWKINGLIGETYTGPTRQQLPAPQNLKSAAPSNKKTAKAKASQPLNQDVQTIIFTDETLDDSSAESGQLTEDSEP